MTTIAGLPYAEVRFDRQGGHLPPEQALIPNGHEITDLIVISHGWHQGGRDAFDMYEALLANLKTVLVGADGFDGRSFAVAGVFWPSDKYTDDLSLEREPEAVGGPAVGLQDEDMSLADLKALARRVADLLDLEPAELAGLAGAAVHGGADADDLVARLREALAADTVDDELREEHGDLLSQTPGSTLVDDLALATASNRVTEREDAGGAAAFDDQDDSPAVNLLSGPRAVIARLLNQAAYFELKRRAATVGVGLAGVIDAEGLPGGVRLHLVGHSFGARLVTAAAAALQRRPDSLVLLQAAFSHNAFGVDVGKRRIDGGFRTVVSDGRVQGPIVISHTWNDTAVGIAYAVASAASGEIAAGLLKVSDKFGGASDIHGGLGANGALRLKNGEGATAVFDGTGFPDVSRAKVTSLKCDFITNHGDVAGPGAARLVAAAIR